MRLKIHNKVLKLQESSTDQHPIQKDFKTKKTPRYTLNSTKEEKSAIFEVYKQRRVISSMEV